MAVMTMKNTKQELLDAYTAALEEVEKVKAMKRTPAVEYEEKRQVEVEKNACLAVESNIFNEAITKQYTDLQESINKKSAELEELYGIEAQASSLAAIINASKEKEYQLNEEYKSKKVALENEYNDLLNEKKAELEETKKLIAVAREEIRTARNEEIEKVNVERKREKEEYTYNLKRARKIENDAWEDEKAVREKEIADKEQQTETLLNEAKESVKEFEELKAKVAEFPELIAKTEKEAKEAGQKEAAKEYGYKKTMYEKEKEYEIAKLEDKVVMLQEKLTAQEAKTEELQTKLDEAYTRMSALATDTVKANGAVRIVSSGNNPVSK